MPVMLLSQRFYDLSFHIDYFVLTVICTFSPCVGVVPLMLRYPFGALRMVVLAAGPYMSLLVSSSLAVLSYVFFRTAVFSATGDRSGNLTAPLSPTSIQTSVPLVNSQPRSKKTPFNNAAWTTVLEVSLGALLIWMCFLTLNLSLLGFAVAILLAPVLMRVNWNTPLLRPCLYLPYLVLIVGVFFGMANLLPGLGMPLSAFMFAP
jgi:hypothetical protein